MEYNGLDRRRKHGVGQGHDCDLGGTAHDEHGVYDDHDPDEHDDHDFVQGHVRNLSHDDDYDHVESHDYDYNHVDSYLNMICMKTKSIV